MISESELTNSILYLFLCAMSHGTKAHVAVFTLLFLLLSHVCCQDNAHGKEGIATVEQYKARDSYGHHSYSRASDDGMARLQTCWRGENNDNDFDHCQEDCPNPQPADEVVDAYEGSYSFTWTTLAGGTSSTSTTMLPRQDDPLNNLSGQRSHGSRSPGADKLLRAMQPSDQDDSVLSDMPQQPSHNHPMAPHPDRFAAPPTPAQSSIRQRSRSIRRVRPFDSESPDGQQASTTAASTTSQAQPAAVADPAFQAEICENDPGAPAGGFPGTTGTSPDNRQALAAAPHPDDPEALVMLHCVDAVCEIFKVLQSVHRLYSAVPTKLKLQTIVDDMGYTKLEPDFVQAFFDLQAQRFVVAFASKYKNISDVTTQDDPPHLFVCVSQSRDPTSSWVCWALSAVPRTLAGGLCAQPPAVFDPSYPKVSYSCDGLFVSIKAQCANTTTDASGALHALFVFPKAPLYAPPNPGLNGTVSIYRATYLPSSAWYRSLPRDQQLLDFYPEDDNSMNQFNTSVLPSRPQCVEDVADPYFVIGKVDGNLNMSIAKLTNEPLELMKSLQTAPRIYATVIPKGADFRNVAGFPEGNEVLPQPDGAPDLPVHGVGRVGPAYGATHHQGLVYVATSDFFGERNERVPSIYYAIIEPSPRLCQPNLREWGMVASADGLALAFPVIAATRDAGAFLAFAYSGSHIVMVDGQRYNAYPGAATAVVGRGSTCITIVKRGEVAVTDTCSDCVWGDYSAIQVVDGAAWFAVPVALQGIQDAPWGSWIGKAIL